jgi:SAM-dependent methyltransferase
LTSACQRAAISDHASLIEARRYAALQPFIVDKGPLFDALLGLVGGGDREPGRVVELGVGTGGFLEAVARAGAWPRASLVGADMCSARIQVAREIMESLGRPADLWFGVNALDAGDPFFERVVPAGTADVVVLSQFEHYAPNDDRSPLARRLDQAGWIWSSKAALRRFAASRLRPGGWLFVVDDYAAETTEAQARWDRAWDAHVVDQFARAEVVESLTALDPHWAESMGRRYAGSRPWEVRLQLVARARARRRHRDREEVQTLRAACEDFREIFGAQNHGRLAHPMVSVHPQFHLLWGRRPS